MSASGPVKVAVLMGSDSDLPVMKKCFEQLEQAGVRWDAVVASAHRTPERVARYVAEMEAQGVCCFICAAGGAAHLAGAVAAQTTLPVLGVPVESQVLVFSKTSFQLQRIAPATPRALYFNDSVYAGLRR